MEDRLTPLQRAILDAFFEHAPSYFLTGGAALAGYHLGHRTTHDLDLFVTEERLDEGVMALRVVAERLGATLESLRTSPHQRRYLVRLGDEAVVVDLVFDPTPQSGPKQAVGRVRVDGRDEIFANKLCALLSRAELRDLVDVMFLERSGCDLHEGLAAAMRKDGGLTPGQLAWVLSEVAIGEDAIVPGDVSPAELREYLGHLGARLERLALPEQGRSG